MIEVFSKLIMFVVTISVGRYLGIQGFGTYNYALSYVALFTIFSDLGVSTVLTRDIAKHKDKASQYLGNTLGLRVVTSFFILLLILISLPFLGHNQAYLFLILLVTLSSLSQQFLGLLGSVLIAFEKMEYVFISKISYFIGILISALLVVRFNSGINILVASYSTAGILSVVITMYLVNKLNVKIVFLWQKEFWQEILLESFPLFGFIAFSQVYGNLDTLLVGRYFGDQSVGLYQSAYKILYAFQSINIINAATFPRMSVLIHEKKHHTFNRLIKIVIFGSILVLFPLASIISLKSESVISIIWQGRNFLAAATMLPFMIWSGVFNYFRIFTTNILIAKGQQKYVFYSIFIGLAINAYLNFIIMPKVDFTFAAKSLLFSEIIILLATLVFLKFGRRQISKSIS